MDESQPAVGAPVEQPVGRPADLLDMNYINTLPQPLTCRRYGSKYWWPVYDIEVQAGLVRIDVCGKLEVWSISNVAVFHDAAGDAHLSDDFFADPENWIDRQPANA